MARTIHLGELTITFLKSRHETQNCLEAFEITLPPHVGVIVPHLHHACDETILGIDGITLWTVSGLQTQIGPGEKLEIPRGAPHGFHNLHSHGARFLCIHTPGCLGPECFDELACVMRQDGPTNYAALGAIMTRYGVIPAHL